MTDSTSNANTASLVVQATTAAIAAWGIYQYLTYNERWWWNKRKHQRPMEVAHQEGWEDNLIHGFVAPGWESVKKEFVQNFRCRGELGAAVCIIYKGEKVVDLWGGYRDRKTKSPWQKDTLCPLFSTTKGISAFALQMLASRGTLDMDEKVSKYWPEFAENGKSNITVAQLMDHSVGLAGISPPITLEMLQHKDTKTVVRDHLARAKMEWPKAFDYKGYMAVMLGFYESAIVQLVEGSGKERTIGQYLRDEAFIPLGISDEIYIGLPDSIPASRIAKLDGMVGLEALWPTGTFPDGFISKLLLQPSSYTGRAFRNPQISLAPTVMDYDRRDVQRTEIPAANGMATARAVAAVYSAAERAINTKSKVNPLKLSQQTLDRFMQPARPGRKNGWVDEVIDIESCMGAGFLLPAPKEFMGTGRFMCTPNGFGTPGAGGSFGYCDPDAGIAYAYTMNRCGQFIVDDPREFSLRAKMYEVVQELRVSEGLSSLDLQSLNTPHYLSKRYMKAHPELAPL